MDSISWWAGHFFGAGTVAATLAGVAPPIAAFVAFVFYMIQIWESVTIQNMMNTRRKAWKARKIARLRGRVKYLTGELEALDVVHAASVEAKEIVASASVEAEKIKADGIKSNPLT